LEVLIRKKILGADPQQLGKGGGTWCTRIPAAPPTSNLPIKIQIGASNHILSAVGWHNKNGESSKGHQLFNLQVMQRYMRQIDSSHTVEPLYKGHAWDAKLHLCRLTSFGGNFLL